MISIGFTGAGGVGKGTLGESLSRSLDIRFVRSSVQSVGQELFPRSKNFSDMTPADKYLFQHCAVIAQMETEKIFRSEGDSFLAERSVLDFIPYFLKVFGEEKELCSNYQQMVWDYLKDHPYDYLVYIPVEFRPSADDMQRNAWKERNESSQQHTDAVIRDLISSMAFQGIQIPKIIRVSGSVEERVQQCINEITKVAVKQQTA